MGSKYLQMTGDHVSTLAANATSLDVFVDRLWSEALEKQRSVGCISTCLHIIHSCWPVGVLL